MKKITSVAIVAALAGAASFANAGFTTVQTGGTFGGGNANGASDGTSVVNILSRMYGGDFDTSVTGVTGSIYGTLNIGGVTATRVHDFLGSDDVLNQNVLGSVLQLGAGAAGSTDQVWQDGTVTFEARARYAGDAQFFGFRAGDSGGSGFTNTAISVGPGYDGTLSNGISIGSGNPFRWMRANNSAGDDNVQLSRASENAQEANVSNDQMIAFEIDDGSGTRRYVLFFEDIDVGGDRDFNDLAIELSVIPLPTGAALGMAGMGLLAIRRRGVR